MNHPIAALLATAMCGTAAAQDGSRAPASAFDGRWSVSLVCDDVKQSGTLVKGYEFRFFVDVSGGRLHGQYGSPGSPSSVVLVGTVAGDGTLELEADGHTGRSDHTVGRVPQGTHYHYTMEGRLAVNEGTARRRELRPCTATFAKSR